MNKKELRALRRPFVKDLFRNNKFNLFLSDDVQPVYRAYKALWIYYGQEQHNPIKNGTAIQSGVTNPAIAAQVGIACFIISIPMRNFF